MSQHVSAFCSSEMINQGAPAMEFCTGGVPGVPRTEAVPCPTDPNSLRKVASPDHLTGL